MKLDSKTKKQLSINVSQHITNYQTFRSESDLNKLYKTKFQIQYIHRLLWENMWKWNLRLSLPHFIFYSNTNKSNKHLLFAELFLKDMSQYRFDRFELEIREILNDNKFKLLAENCRYEDYQVNKYIMKCMLKHGVQWKRK